jgi:hypothetical protein
MNREPMTFAGISPASARMAINAAKKELSFRGDPSLAFRMTKKELFCCHPEPRLPK